MRKFTKADALFGRVPGIPATRGLTEAQKEAAEVAQLAKQVNNKTLLLDVANVAMKKYAQWGLARRADGRVIPIFVPANNR